MRHFPRVVALLLALAALGASAPAQLAAAQLPEEREVESGQQALSGAARFPWYDKSRDDVRPLHVVPRQPADSSNRASPWTRTPTTATTGGTPVRITWLGRVLQWLGISVLIVLLALLAYLVAKAFLLEEISETTTVRKVVESARDVDRVEALPFAIRKPTGDFLEEARRLYEAGHYSEAIVYLFSYQLVELDRRHLIRLAKGKTNRQYLRELRRQPRLAGILENTMIAFEDAFFGRKQLPAERFEACWRLLADFHASLEHSQRSAA